MSRFNKKLNSFGEPSPTLSAQPNTNIISSIPLISPSSSTRNISGSSLSNSSNVVPLPNITPNTNTQRHSNNEFNKNHPNLNFANSNSTPTIKFSNLFTNIKEKKDQSKLDEAKILFENENSPKNQNSNRLSVLSQINGSLSDQTLTPGRFMINKSELKGLKFDNGYFAEPKNSKRFNLDIPKKNAVYFDLNDSFSTSSSKANSSLLPNFTPSRSSSASSVSLSSSTASLSRLEAIDSDKFRKIKMNSGYLLIGDKRIEVKMNQLVKISTLGNGTSGVVYKMMHKPTGFEIAVKQMNISSIEQENKRILTDVDVIAKSNNCKNIVKCLGYIISESDVCIFMELMMASFDKLLLLNNGPLPERIIGKLSVSILSALNYLKEEHNMMHRDIKPSNILIDQNGEIKLCDFGISGRLENSRAFSKNNIGNLGSAGYTAPERIGSTTNNYDVRADVWSFGISVVEFANGEFPYKNCTSEFEILTSIMDKDPPKLEGDQFSEMFKSFINSCLEKDFEKRPKYNTLLNHEFIIYYQKTEVDVKNWLYEILNDKNQLE